MMLPRPSSLQGIGWGALLLPILFFSNASASEVACAWEGNFSFKGCWDDGKEKAVNLPQDSYFDNWIFHTHPIDRSFSLHDVKTMMLANVKGMVVLSPNRVYYFYVGRLSRNSRKTMIEVTQLFLASGKSRSQALKLLAFTLPQGDYKVYNNPGYSLTKDGLKQLAEEIFDAPPHQ